MDYPLDAIAILEHRIHQSACANNVCLEELQIIENRSCHMGFGCKMNDRI